MADITNKITIHWFQSNLKNLSAEHDTYFYAFSRANKLLYIGKSHFTELKNEVNQNLKRLNISNIGLVIWVGYMFDESVYKNKLQELVDDAESLLIYRNKTQFNEKKTKSYRGRVPFKVISVGMPLLKKTITITTSSPLQR